MGALVKDDAEKAVKALLIYVHEDPERDGLLQTPSRVVRAFEELCAGYRDDPQAILATTFDCGEYDEVILLRRIRFTSLCEHHLLPFVGTADVAYIPGKVVGLSKLARLVQCYARRLQIQERLTQQIARAIEEHLGARAVGVVVRARHLCMGCRGVRQPEAEMITSSMLGAFRTNGAARAELLSLMDLRGASGE